MRFFILNLGPEPRAFGSCYKTPRYLVCIENNKVGFFRQDGSVEWDDMKGGWTVDQVNKQVERKNWLEINQHTAHDMGFTVQPIDE